MCYVHINSNCHNLERQVGVIVVGVVIATLFSRDVQNNIENLSDLSKTKKLINPWDFKPKEFGTKINVLSDSLKC